MKTINKYSSSSYCPHVLASDQLQFWSSPYAISRRNAIISHIPATISANLMDVMLVSLEEKTQSNYGARLLCFTQFCDTHGIAKADHCPASKVLISAFIASYAGLCSSDCINSWLSGIKWWHIFQGVEWYGGNMLVTVKKGVAKLVPESSQRDKRDPVTLEHMHCLLHGLNLSNMKDVAVYDASSVTFYGLCRLAEWLFLAICCLY